ncbi:DeoR/GlpR family DNA-binding transcription regulator [Paramicrobacterium chengjingii]|uniref:Lactose phosphotransferase system repressor n=1 Tax=Paramicrobacterium chengjingii TaxID=2769067 RepID=A0ABX6YIS2_9MICO|nr:DeoR/GlpR family DNA-binding transcription regulator [Microbacterium chengjingii]QPZ38237.1 DeoR/GlpR transcriptional regulator [Microbacterium chengjingii]
MFALERRQLIVKEAREHGRVDVADVAENTGVSSETVRRDLTFLEQQNLLKRVHGGAVPVEVVASVPDVDERTDIQAGAKRAIGKAAFAHLPEHGTVLIDAGTTTAQVAAMIPENREMTVVTNGMPIAESLVRHPLLTVHVLGGRLRSTTLATVDHWALEQLKSLDIDVAFMGTYGVSLTRGFSTPDSFEGAVKRAMVRCAKKVIVVADSSKIGESHMSVFAPLEDVDVLITDAKADRKQVAELKKSGIRVETTRSVKRGKRE